MNRTFFFKNTTELRSSTQLYLHELKQLANCIWPIEINFVQIKKVVFSSVIMLSVLLAFSCKQNEANKRSSNPKTENFNANTLLLDEHEHTKKVKGQLLYMPIYSNVPYFEFGRKFDLSAFVAIHNTDLRYPIKVTKVLFFDNAGKLVANYLSKDTVISPLGAADFFIPERDQSGTGANFLIEWVSDTLVNEPLIETVMLGLTSGQGVSFSSVGKVIRERK